MFHLFLGEEGLLGTGLSGLESDFGELSRMLRLVPPVLFSEQARSTDPTMFLFAVIRSLLLFAAHGVHTKTRRSDAFSVSTAKSSSLILAHSACSHVSHKPHCKALWLSRTAAAHREQTSFDNPFDALLRVETIFCLLFDVKTAKNAKSSQRDNLTTALDLDLVDV